MPILHEYTAPTAPSPASADAATATAAGPAARPGHPPPRRADPLPAGCPRVSVVIPARDEALNLPWVLGELPPGLHEVILVDGGSADGTVEAARRACPGIRIVDQSRRGKGNALVCGLAACTGDIAVLLDADYSADPAEIAAFVAALVDGADLVKGSRFLPGGGSTDLTALRRTGNKALLFLANRIYHTGFSDLCYGYNACWTDCVRDLDLPPTEAPGPEFGDGFEFETLLAAHAALARLDVAEVPSFERDRRYGASHLNTWRDGWRVLHAIVRERPHARATVRRGAHPVLTPDWTRNWSPEWTPAADEGDSGYWQPGRVAAPPVLAGVRKRS